MKRQGWPTVLSLSIVALIALGQGPCLPDPFPPPPFDATGTFAGTWSGTSSDGQQTQDCAISMTLMQDVNATFPLNRMPRGTITMDMRCLDFPLAFLLDASQESPIAMLLGDNGEMDSVGLSCATIVCFLFALDADGTDTDSDGLVDEFNGAWDLTLTIPSMMGVEDFNLLGTFSVQRSESP